MLSTMPAITSTVELMNQKVHRQARDFVVAGDRRDLRRDDEPAGGDQHEHHVENPEDRRPTISIGGSRAALCCTFRAAAGASPGFGAFRNCDSTRMTMPWTRPNHRNARS